MNQHVLGFRVRLVQFGSADEAWVLNPEYPRHWAAIKKLIETGPTTWFINMVFDLVALEVMGCNFDRMAARARDVGIDSRLIDPRGRDKGGSGHSMDDLARHYLKLRSKLDARKALHEEHDWGKGNKPVIEEVFRLIPTESPVYEIYAGQDVFLTARLAARIHPIVDGRDELRRLHGIEHNQAIRCARMERIGMPFDHEWANRSEAEFDQLRDAAEDKLKDQWGVKKKSAKWAHTSATTLKAMFLDMGAKLAKRTKPSKTYPDGQLSLDADVLKELSYESGKVGAFATDILTAKRSEHYGGYIRGMRAELGADGRVHAKVHTLAAATARMSVTSPPIQQFPRGDQRIRGCLLADPGEVIICSDYAQIEFRVAAALSRDPVMTARILNGEDLHRVTALALFGPGFNNEQRQASKPIGFGRLYLGGPTGIRAAMIKSDTTGYVPPLHDIQRAVKAFDRDYRVNAQWGKRLIKQVSNAGGHLTTITGRPLIVDKDYAAVNYAIQSVARDVLAAGITNIHNAGLGDRIRLVVHDEVVASAAPDDAEEVMYEIQRCMTATLKGIPLITEAEIKGPRWAK